MLALGAIWLGFASIHDLRKKIVFNWLSFSLIIFALGFRFFYSLFNDDFSFFYQGVIGLGIFFVIGNLLYYARVFAGGDAKLMIALGPLIAFSNDFFANLETFLLFFLLFLFSGAVYGLGWSIYLSFKNSEQIKREMGMQFRKHKKLILAIGFFGLFFILYGVYMTLFFYIGIMLLLFPCLYIYSKSIDKVCLVKKINTKNLQEGDLLFRDVKVNKKTIKADWHGLDIDEIKEIKKTHKIIMIREGIPFVPVFFISFLLLIYFWYFNSLNLLRLF